MSDKLKIIIIDDDENIRKPLSFILEDEGYEVAESAEGLPALERMSGEFFNVALVDYKLPDITGIDIAKKIRQVSPDTRVIMITGHGSLEIAVEAIREAVFDYLQKPVNPENVKKVIHRALEQQRVAMENRRLADDLSRANEELQVLARIDGLTGLINRREFDSKITDALAHTRRAGGQMALVMFDLDHFKNINDTYGHLTGDIVLKGVAAILQEAAKREVDFAARYGGEEMCLVFGYIQDSGWISRGLEEIRQKVASTTFTGEHGEPIRVTLSAGCAVFPTQAKVVEELIARADEALYKAKQSGRNRVVLYGETV